MTNQLAAPAPTTLFFGPFRLMPAQQALYQGDRRVRLGSRAFDILLVLLERPGELVAAETLVARVWPRLHVEATALRVHVSGLRKALGDDPAAPLYVLNVAGRGYRFIAPVRAGDEAPARPESGLPAASSRLIGRETTVRLLMQRLQQRRFLTITGPGGMGKTTIALAIAERMADSYRDSALFVDLASLADAALVPNAVAAALQLQLRSHNPATDLIASLQHRQMLILLDNCEHVVGAAAALAERILAAAPGVDILATSREPLRAAGEWVHRLQPLDVPRYAAAGNSDAVLNAPAVLLFAERARAANDSFALSVAEAPAIADICHRLDGIPLAIELAAARVEVFGVRGLAVHLNDSFALLVSGRRSALPRHRTLRAALDWSYQLLPACEQRLLRRLAIFRGGFTAQAAQAVAGRGSGAFLDGLANLVSKSLINAMPTHSGAQYRLLETTRAYAADALTASGERPALARCHAVYFGHLFEAAEADWEAKSEPEWRAIYAHAIDDVRAALDWAGSPGGDAALGAALTASSAPLWFSLAMVAEYRGWAERALAAIGGAGADGVVLEMRLNVSLGAALFSTSGPVPAVAAAAARALAIATALGDKPYQLRALWGLARDSYVRGDYQQALRFCEGFDGVAVALRDAPSLLVRDRMMALGLHLVGRQTEARPYADRALSHPAALTRSIHKSFHEYDSQVASRSHLSRILWLQGFADQAAALVQEGVDYAVALDYPPPLCYVLVYAACPIAFWTGDVAAVSHYTALLGEQAANLSFGYWQSWKNCYAAVGALGGDDGSAGFRQQVLAVRATAATPIYIDMLATLRPDLAGPEALARVQAGQAGWCAAEILRADGVAAIGHGDLVKAEAILRRSLALAQEQGARSWALRSATTLAGLYRDGGQPGAARGVLAPVYDGFTEGFGTADLMRADALMRTL